MNNIKVTLLHHTPLYIASDGARTCWSSQDKSDTIRTRPSLDDSPRFLEPAHIRIGPKDLALIDRVGNQFHHSSILEHISMNFFIDGISRACLQELARHRLASLSVKSSRYTLKELKYGYRFDIEEYDNLSIAEASKYILLTGEMYVDMCSYEALCKLQTGIKQGISNDKVKYCMPEAYRTQLTWTINMRSLQNFLSLRTDKKALPEIQHLAHLIYESLPTDAQSLVAHCIKGEDDETV